MYSHKISYLIEYANSLGINLVLPSYIETNADVLTSWETQGRYDVHMSVNIRTINKCYDEICDWYTQLSKLGYK